MNLLTRLRFGIAGVSYKAAQIPFVPQWVKQSWLEPSFDRLTKEGYSANAAVYACVSTLAFSFPEAPLQVYDMSEEPFDNHPLMPLLRRPNEVMSEAELATYVITYLAIGGNCFLHKVRNAQGQVVELWPYHPGHMLPVPSRNNWVEEYEYDLADGNKQRIPAEDIIHLKWPLVDLQQPWLAMPPLRAVAREVDTDNELTRYMYALLANDAMPRTAIQMPEGVVLNDMQFERLRAQWQQRHGMERRGGVAFLEGGARIDRISLNMQELAFDALRRVPEARIAAAFRVPAIMAGLNVGLERSTYANFEEARKQFTEQTLVPLWRVVAEEIEQDLGAEFGGNIIVRHDISRVAALQENEDAKYTRTIEAFAKGLLTRNEGRKLLGFEEVPEGDIFREQLTLSDTDNPPEVTVERPRQLPAPKGLKAAPEGIESQIEKVAAAVLEEHYARAARAVTSG